MLERQVKHLTGPDGVRIAYWTLGASMTRNPALEAAARPLIQLVTVAFGRAASKGGLRGSPPIMALQWAVLEAVKQRRPQLAQERMVDLMDAAYIRLHGQETDSSRSISWLQ
jgi:DNA-binding FadR family transcriptional regulator